MPIVVDKEEKIKELCQKAYEEFMKNGIESFSLNKFISTIEISKGQFYHYFKTKDELVFEVMSQKTMELIKSTNNHINSAGNLLEKLSIFFSLYISEDDDSQMFRSLMFDCFNIYIHSKETKVKKYNKDFYKWSDNKLIEIFQDENVDTELYPFLKSISATADGIYLRSLMIDHYDLQIELTNYLTQIVMIIEKKK